MDVTTSISALAQEKLIGQNTKSDTNNLFKGIIRSKHLYSRKL